MTMESLAELVRFAPDAYGVRYLNHVAMFIVTDAGVVLTDPCGEINPRAPYFVKEAIRSVTDRPVTHLLYSHWGGDHGMGGAAFLDSAPVIIAHKNTAPKVAALNDPASPPPTVTFDKPYAIELGGKRIDLYPADMADNDDYFILHYPEGKLVMFVDLVQPRSIAFRTLLGHPDRIMERLKWLHDSLDFDILISGHAQPTMTVAKSEVPAQRQYYADLSAAIDGARARGLADASDEMKAAVRATLAPKYGDWRRFGEMVAENVDGMIGWRAGKNLRFT